MTFNEYQNQASRTMNGDLTQKETLTNAALGLAGEAGEVADMVKKEVFHGHLVDDGQYLDELGDLLWYVAWLAKQKGWSLDEVAERNIQKLEQRYPDGFSTERSINRGAW